MKQNEMPSFGLQADPNAPQFEKPTMAAPVNDAEANAANNYGYIENPENDVVNTAPKATYESDPSQSVAKKGVFDKGNERFNSIAAAAKSRFAKISGGLGRFFKGAKEVPKKIAVGVLSTPELASKAGEKIGQANEAVAGAMYKGYEATGEWVNETFGDAANAIADGIESAQNFAAEKGAQLAAFAKSEAETFKTAKDAIAKGTVEALQMAKKSIAEDATKLWNYGRNAIGNFYHKQMIMDEVRFSKMNDERLKAIDAAIERANKEKEQINKDNVESRGRAVGHLMKMKGKHMFMKQAQNIKIPLPEREQFAQAA